MFAAQLKQTLGALSDAMKSTRDSWWIIGGAAYSLYGGGSAAINDIDVIVSKSDAARLSAQLNIPNLADTGSEKFRSSWLLRPAIGEVSVEIFADFRIFSSGHWHKVQPKTRQAMTLNHTTLYVPGKKELADIFLACGRAKDLERAAYLLQS